MGIRLEKSTANALHIARWLSDQPQVAEVLCPMLPGAPGHGLWARDFTGGCGLFSFVLATDSPDASGQVVDALEHFGIGYSWGGFESLALPIFPHEYRAVMESPTRHEGGIRAAVRLSIGLEDPEDLIADLAQALDKLEI